MTTESSSLLFGVRTSEAVASLELLQRELDKTLQKFQAISASGPAKFAGAEAEAVAAAKTLNAELKAQARTIDQAGKAMDGASKQTVRFSKRIGEATTSMSFALGESASEVKKWQKAVADAMNDPTLALGSANFAEQRKKAVSDLLSFEDGQRKKYMASLRKDIEERSAAESQGYMARVAQAREGNKQYWADQEASRARELAALKADIQSRSSIEAENSKIRTAQARSANKQYWVDQEASRARELAALKADILTRSKESAEAEKVRLAQAKAANSKYIADEAAARKAELASMRAHITEKLRLQATEQELRARFAEKSLAQQVSTLERIERRIAATGMDSAVARYGSYAVGRRGALAEMQAELNAINETAKAEKRLAAEKIASSSASERASRSIQQNTVAMRDAHSVARGLSGSLGALWMTYGALVPLLAGAAIGGAAAQTFKVGQDIEYRLKMMEALGQEAVKVGQMMDAVNSSMKTPLEGAQALQVLGQAGLTTSESLAALSTTLQLATLGEMDVAEAALTLTSALATFKIEANESAKVGDLFAKAATMSNASVQDLAESLKQAGAGAATYGITLEETVAMLATLAQSGIKASAAGTAIKNATQELYAPTDKAARVMKQVGLEIYDTEGKARNYIEILKDLKRITIEMDQESRNNLIGALFNERSRRAIQIMMNDMSGLQKMLEGVAESAGYLARANDLLLNTVEGAGNRFQSVLQQSYTEAFTALNPLIRQTIASMEEFVGSDTFIGGITATGNAIAGLTTFVSDNIKVIALLAGAYLAARGSVAAYSAVVAAKTALVQGSAAATFAATGAINRETAAIAANTVATNASTAAKAANTATTVTYTSRASAAIAAVSSFSRVFGILGMVLGTAGLALSAMTGSMKDIGTQSDVTVTKVQSVTEAIRQQINAIRERNRQELMRMGLKDETDAGNLQALRDRRDSLDQEAVAAKQKLDDLNSQFAAKTQELLNSRMGGAIRESRNEELKAIREQTAEYERLQAAAQEARKTLEEGESTRAEGEKLSAFNEQYQRLTNLRAQMSQIRDEAMIATDKQEIKGYLDPVEQQLEAVNNLIVQASRNSELSENEVNELMTTWGGLNAKIEETRKNAFKMEESSGGMGGAIKLFNERFNQQKKLAEDMRDFQLKMLEEERKVGLVSTQESAEGRERIWAEYLEKMVQAGQSAQAQIGASGAKEAQKEFGARSIAQKVAAERDRAEQDLTQAQIMEAFKDQREALMSYHNLRMEFWRVEQDMLKDQKDMQEEVAKRYMSARDIAILDARNKAEEKYKKLLEDRQALLEKGLRTNPDFKQTEGGKKLLEAIEKIKQEAPKAGQAMADMAAVLYDKTTSATDGAIRALQTYADQAQDASTQVEQAFTKAFGGIEDALVDLVISGKADFKSLIKSLQADLARLAIRQYITGPLAQTAAGMLGGSAGMRGGSSGSQQQGGVDAMGLARGAKGIYDSYSTGSYGVTDMLYSAGESMGSYTVQNFAAGMAGYMPSAIGSGVAASLGSGAAGTLMTSMPAGAATTFSASLGSGGASSMAGAAGSAVASALPYVGALYAASQGQYGAAAGMALGTAIMPGIGTAIGAVAGTIADSFLNKEPTTRHGQWEWAEMSGDNWGMKFRDSRQPAGTGDAITQYARSAVDSANDMFGKLGVNAAIEYFYATTNSSLKGDRNGVASGGTLIVDNAQAIEFGLMNYGGDRTKYGFGGWSEEEMLPRLQTDIQLSILEAFQTQVDSLPGLLADMIRGVNIRGLDAAGAQALAEQFNAVIQGVDNFRTAVESLPFENLKNLSFDAAANLIQFAGGLDNLNAGLTTYYENFYSETERYETAIGNLGKALGGVGVELPKMVGSADEMKAEYRALVEAQDLNTEAGQKAYAMLIQSSGAFAELATYAGQAAEAVAAAAEQAAAEAQRLASAIRREELDVRRAIEKAQQEAFEASLKAYEEGAKPFDDLRATLLSAGDAAGLLGATLERAFSNPLGKYSYGGTDYKLPRWEADTTASGFNFEYGLMQMRIARDLSDEVSANALRIENAGQALTYLAPNLSEYGPVVGPLAQALTAAVVEASGDMGYAVRDSVHQAMLGVAQQDVYGQFASQGPGLAGIRYAQQQAQWASQVSHTSGFGMQYGADVGGYAQALNNLNLRMKSGQITSEQFDAAVTALNKSMPDAVDLLGDTEAQLQRMADAAHEVSMAGLRSIEHYFGSLREMAAELGKTEEPINQATAAIGRMNSWATAFGESADAAGDMLADQVDQARAIADAAGIAASVLTTRDAKVAAEALSKNSAFTGVGDVVLRDISMLLDGIQAYSVESFERAFIRISDAFAQNVIDKSQYQAMFDYALDAFEGLAESAAQAAQNAARAAIDAGEDAYRQLERAISAERDRIQAESDAKVSALESSISSTSDAIRELESLTNSLESTVSSMLRSTQDEMKGWAWAQAQIEESLSQARRGVMPKGEDIDEALSILSQPVGSMYDSFIDYQADVLATAHAVDELNKLAETQLTTAEKQLQALETQLSQARAWRDAEIERLDAMLESNRQQLDIANGSYQALLTIPQALKGIEVAIAGIKAASQASYAVGTSYVPRDMQADIHKGEIVIDARSSDVLRRYGIGVHGAGDGDMKLILQELREMRLMQQRLLDENARLLKEIADSNVAMADGRAPQAVVVQNVVPTVTAIPGQ